jgi:hypothetical protein
MKFFNLDCHVSVIADLKQIFVGLGHQVDSWSISGHNWIFNRPSDPVEIVTPSTWKNLDTTMVDNFYERYKSELDSYDGFICTYPLSFSLLYEKFKKPIILQIPIRYEVPFHDNKDKWNNFNEFLRNNIDNGLIIPIANSLYDKKYFEFFIERECKLIPNICEYTDTKWEGTSDKFLYYSRLPFDHDLLTNKNNLGKYKWSDISKFKGIVVIPYNCSTMSIFEYYTSNIPLFVPSKKLMLNLYREYPNHVLTDLTWNKVFGMRPGSIIECDKNNDPNDYKNLEIMNRWISFSDFYNEEWMPHIIYFDDFDELIFKLKTTNLNEVSEKIKNFNITRKNKIYKMWDETISKLI